MNDNTKRVGLTPWKAKADENRVCPRTLDNWVRQKIFDEPIRINGRKYARSDAAPKIEQAE